MEGDRRRRWPWVLVGVALCLSVGLAVSSRYWYTPTTSASVINNSSAVYSLDNCEDFQVTIAPGQSAQVQPFSDVHHGCTVYRGRTDLGPPIGCLGSFQPATEQSSRGRTSSWSTMVPFTTRWCSA